MKRIQPRSIRCTLATNPPLNRFKRLRAWGRQDSVKPAINRQNFGDSALQAYCPYRPVFLLFEEFNSFFLVRPPGCIPQTNESWTQSQFRPPAAFEHAWNPWGYSPTILPTRKRVATRRIVNSTVCSPMPTPLPTPEPGR